MKKIKTYMDYEIFKYKDSWYKIRSVGGRMSPKSYDSVEEAEEDIIKKIMRECHV